MWGDQISFQSILGDYLSVEGDQVSTRRYCSADERFTVEKRDTQYSIREVPQYNRSATILGIGANR